MAGKKYPGYEALDPFLDLVVEAVRDRVDGDHFWDILADDATMEYPYRIPGFPEATKGRQALMEMLRPYGTILFLERMSDLRTYVAGDVVVLDYWGHGYGVKDKRRYDNHYISVITIENRKIVNFRSFENPLVVLETLGSADALIDAMV